MKVNDIIVLDNEKSYALLNEVNYDNSKFFFASLVENDIAQKEKLVILKLVSKEDGNYIEMVEDKELITKLTNMLEDTTK